MNPLKLIFGLTDINDQAEDESPAEAARRRQAWLGSPELERWDRTRNRFLYGTLPVAGLGFLGEWAYNNHIDHTKAIQTMAITCATYLYLGIPLLAAANIRARRNFQDKTLIGIALEELRRAEDEAAEPDVSFHTLWVATQRRLDYYHKIATSQAEKSFLYGQIAAGAGFLILVTSAVVAAFARTNTASVVIGATGITASGIGAYMGSTFLKIQERASQQLGAYFAQPLEFSKFLAAERLLQSLDQEGKNAAVRDIISAISGAPPAKESTANPEG
ncbi:hypothetical protein GXW82_35455 [Streptacidiphilus sp. 4-A2]|nr:hypothetical protein [Streptacidiphilus sp. 4-A2]